MPLIMRNLDQFPRKFRGGAVAIGNFDGVHAGHRRLVGALVEQARRMSAPAIVFTFDPPPVAVLRPDIVVTPPLTTIERRSQLLGELGVDVVIAYRTNPHLLALSAEDFFQTVLQDAMGARAIAEGPNFRFGHNRLGDTVLLERLCKQAGMSLTIVTASNDDGGMISSTRIKQLIKDGQVGHANELLVDPYQLIGQVAQGAGRGRSLGSPTANLIDICVQVPCGGVYAGFAEVDQQHVAAAIHIGPNPTFAETLQKVEIHLIDWQGDLYGSQLRCFVLDRLRETLRFSSPEELRRQIGMDVERCRTIFAKYSAKSH
jgi:riboflavin kinase / FMN adenylyltransferase